MEDQSRGDDGGKAFEKERHDVRVSSVWSRAAAPLKPCQIVWEDLKSFLKESAAASQTERGS